VRVSNISRRIDGKIIFLKLKMSRRNVLEKSYTVYASTIFFFFLNKATCFDQNLVIFRPLQHFPLPDALPTLGSHSVYNCGIHLVKTF